MRNFICPATEAACERSECKKDFCVIQKEEDARRADPGSTNYMKNPQREDRNKMNDDAAESALDFDIGAIIAQIEREEEIRRIRKERPWARDLIRVLWPYKAGLRRLLVIEDLWQLRRPIRSRESSNIQCRAHLIITLRSRSSLRDA